MQQVATVRNVTRNTRGVNIFQTHGTVRSGHVFDTPMAIVFQLHRQTHVAHLAVEEARPAADSANSAPVAVVLRAVLVIEQVAHQAGVLAEPDAALFALGLDALPGVALGAYQLRDRLPVEEVRLVFVVTVPAHVELVTARCHKFGPSLVVCTPDPFLIRILLLGRPRRRRLGRILFRCRHLECGPAAARYTSDFRDLFARTHTQTLSPCTFRRSGPALSSSTQAND